MSNIPVKRSFTASAETYNNLEIKTRGLFVYIYNILYIKNTNKMLAHFKNAPNSYLRNLL